MHKFFDLGMSDPLTLGMASPLADRIEILARKRPVTRLSRALAGSVLLMAAAISAPLTIAEAHPESKVEARSVVVFSDGATWSTDGETKLKSGGAYEIITEDGEVTAYKISNGGKTKTRVDVEMLGSDNYQLTLKNGESVIFDKPDLSELEDLKALAGLRRLEGLKRLEDLRELEGLRGLEGLQGLEGLKALRNLKGLEKLSGLSDLSRLESLSALSELDFGDLVDDDEVRVVVNGRTLRFSGDDELSKDNLREKIQRAIKGEGTVEGIRVFTSKDGEVSNWIERGKGAQFPEWTESQLPDTVISFGDEGVRVERSIDSVERQLSNAERQLERLSEDEEMSKELKQALRDLAKAKRSLEKAQTALED